MTLRKCRLIMLIGLLDMGIVVKCTRPKKHCDTSRRDRASGSEDWV